MENNMTETNTIWTALFSAIGFVFLYGVIGIIWAVRLEAKVKSIREVFNMFLENDRENSRIIKESIDKLFECQRKIEEIVNRMYGR